eukprot:GHVP01039107.1.p1 GENE.GHVP01039107.1~~GHVP01039107.1.p1  ORF type:complete len:872 (-),score=146.87 GHVP01039107.1:1733-4348(-)
MPKARHDRRKKRKQKQKKKSPKKVQNLRPAVSSLSTPISIPQQILQKMRRRLALNLTSPSFSSVSFEASLAQVPLYHVDDILQSYKSHDYIFVSHSLLSTFCSGEQRSRCSGNLVDCPEFVTVAPLPYSRTLLNEEIVSEILPDQICRYRRFSEIPIIRHFDEDPISPMFFSPAGESHVEVFKDQFCAYERRNFLGSVSPAGSTSSSIHKKSSNSKNDSGVDLPPEFPTVEDPVDISKLLPVDRFVTSCQSPASESSSTSEITQSEDHDCTESDEEGVHDYKKGGYHFVLPGEIYEKRYRVEAKVGWGHFSTVWLGTDLKAKNPHYVALKFQKSAKHYEEAALDEIQLLKRCLAAQESNSWKLRIQEYKRRFNSGISSESRVVSLLSYFFHRGIYGKHVCMVFEAMGPNLLSLIKLYEYKGVPLKLLKKIARDILIGLDFLHSVAGIIHTDLKPENILVTHPVLPSPRKLNINAESENSPNSKPIFHAPTEEASDPRDSLNQTSKLIRGVVPNRRTKFEAGNTIYDIRPSPSDPCLLGSTAALQAAAMTARAPYHYQYYRSRHSEEMFRHRQQHLVYLPNNTWEDLEDEALNPVEEDEIYQSKYSGSDMSSNSAYSSHEATESWHGLGKDKNSRESSYSIADEETSSEDSVSSSGTEQDERVDKWAHLRDPHCQSRPANACFTTVYTSEGPVNLKETQAEAFSEENSVFKIVDLGNACWLDCHFSDDIQTRQYRSPEVVVRSGYDTSADIWSFACVMFEIATGEYLFEPKPGGSYQRDDDHLALMSELLGDFPRCIFKEGKRSDLFFAADGSFLNIPQLKHWSIFDVLVQKYKFSHSDATELVDFLLPMLTLDPKLRASASTMLQHSFIKT